MINTQLITGILVAVAALAGLAIVLAVALQATASATKPGRAPHGGIRRAEPELPQPDDARELVLR
jgi:hypothetical protein